MLKVFETKVIAAVGGALGSGVLSSFALWLLGVFVFGASSKATEAAAATASVPEPVQGVVIALLGAAGAGIAGYLAPHTPRLEEGDTPARH